MTPRNRVLADIATGVGRVRVPHTVRVAIDGIDAVGKTTLADELAEVIQELGRPLIRASIDGFHNPRTVRRARGALSPEGYFLDSFDHAALIEVLLQPLGPGGSGLFRRAVFDFRTDQPVTMPPERATADAVLLFDGVFLLRDKLRGYFDFSVFVRAGFDVTLKRAERRDLELFGSVEEVRRASVIIENDDPARPRIGASVGD